MCNKFLLVAACLAAFVYVSNAEVPFIKKCKEDDSKCAKESTAAVIGMFADGIPEYNVKKMDPLTLKRVDCTTASLKLVLEDMVLVGLKSCRAKKVQRDVPNNKLILKILCDKIDMDGHYEMGGTLLILPIEGSGKIHVTQRKTQIFVEVQMGEIEKDGKKHWDIKGYKHKSELKDKSDLVFENLFNGNELLGRAARELIASNSNDIINELGPPVTTSLVDEIIKNINNFFHAVPAEDLTL